MQNIFIAVGGSGAKVAEAFVRLLAAGFPTRFEPGGVPTSAGDDLQIWRLDPDRNSGAAQALQKAVDEYAALLDHLRQGEAPNRWGMEIDRDAKGNALVRHLDPLALQSGNNLKTLRDILHSHGQARNGKLALDGQPFLSLFYEPKDLDVEVDRGFYQKPFIGAPIMAIFADSLKKTNSSGGHQCQFSYLEQQSVRFFLCGSLHGGTGACGVPVMGHFLGEYKKAKSGLDWHLGGCLLAPYSLPPEPPFEQLQEAQKLAAAQDEDGLRSLVSDYVRRYGHAAPFNGLATYQEKHQLAKQILLGFYAQRSDMTERARHSLIYYNNHIAPYFNALYLVGKPAPDALTEWSNGGSSQQNPLNSAEIVAALAALDFFAGTHDRERPTQSYIIGNSTRTLGDQMNLSDLPRYALAQGHGLTNVDPEKILLATALMCHLVRHQVPWNTSKAKEFPPDFNKLKQYYAAYPDNEGGDRMHYPPALEIITRSIQELLAPQRTQGWDGRDYVQLSLLLSDQPMEVATVTEKLQTGLLSREAKDNIVVGQSALRVSKKEFPAWTPPGKEFARGDYLRCVWWNLLSKMPA